MLTKLTILESPDFWRLKENVNIFLNPKIRDFWRLTKFKVNFGEIYDAI